MKRIILISLLFLMTPVFIWSQVYGKVVDESDDTPLPFATVVGVDKYAIASEEGEFKYRGKEGDRLTISYLGYRDTTIIAKNNMVIRMKNDGIMSDEVVITDANYISPYELLIKAKKKYKSLDHDVIRSKLFVKRETINNGVWSDQTETLYSAKQHKGKIYELSFQHGKSYVNNKNDLIFTLDLLTVLQEEEIFSKYSKYLYTSACSMGSAKKIKKKYQGNYKEWKSNGKEYYIVDTKSKNANKFDSELTISADNFDLTKLKQRIINPSKTAFRSLLTNRAIDLDSLTLEYVFDEWNGAKVISSLSVSYSYLLNGIQSKNNINLKFFDYGIPFYDLVSKIDYDILTDYQRIWNTPYNDEFWNGQNLTFSNLDTLSDYIDLNLGSSNLLLRKRYLTIPEVQELGLSHFEQIPRMDDGAKAMIKFDPMDMKTQRHVNAHLYAHLYTVDNERKATIIPLIDHQRSFVLKNTPMMDSLFYDEISIVRSTAEEALSELASNPLEESDKPYKSLKKLAEKYNKLLKKRLSEMDAYQNRDWSATRPNTVEKLYRNIGRRN